MLAAVSAVVTAALLAVLSVVVMAAPLAVTAVRFRVNEFHVRAMQTLVMSSVSRVNITDYDIVQKSLT